MQTSIPQQAQRKKRWPSITGAPAGDVSGRGLGVGRCSTAERRFDHRDDPEGSGVLAPGLRLVSGTIELPDDATASYNSAHSARG
jgi:hypothetical protein